jgi:UDP-3-O-[3-hydroxymyristoyl] glucosamine N-acyltransferase
MAGHSGVAGSSVLGDRVVLAGQSGIGDNLKIGNDVIATAKAAVLSNVQDGQIIMPLPSVKKDKQLEIYKSLLRLPRLMRDLPSRQK